MPSNSYSVALIVNDVGASRPAQWVGGRGMFTAVATWGGGSVALNYRGPDGVTWLDVPTVSLNANGGTVFDLPPGEIRAVPNTATAVYATVARIP